MKSWRSRKLLHGFSELPAGDSSVAYYMPIDSGKHHCALELWNYEYFLNKYPKHDLKQIMTDFREAIVLPNYILGKRSSEIIISKSRRYSLKIISEEDYTYFLAIFPSYNQFIENEKSNALVDIYGVFRVTTFAEEPHKTSTANKPGSNAMVKSIDVFMLMPNVRYGSYNYGVMYDLKGYVYRISEPQDVQDFHFGKDGNFVNSPHCKLVCELHRSQREWIVESVSRNIYFLRYCGIIDYSLLLMFEKVVVSEEVVFEDKALSGVKNLHNRVKVAPDMVLHWCLIDFLQLYNERKKLENKFKSLFFKDISSIDPEGYARRIILFLKGVLHIDT